MDNYVTLIGAETVQSAASSMRVSAEQIQHAANIISESVDRLIREMHSFLETIESQKDEETGK